MPLNPTRVLTAAGAGGAAVSQRGAVSMGLADVLGRLEADIGRHMTSGPSNEEELQRLEAALGHPLPSALRTLLARLGAGLYYDKHEIFGPHRLQIHDIELMPSLLALRASLGEQVPEGVVPFHRAEGVVHLIDLRDQADAERIVSLPYGANYPDLTSFLLAVVIPKTN